MENILTFKHSGHSGDLIYSLAAVQAVCKRKNAKAIYYVQLDVKTDMKGHSMGGTMINRKQYDFLHDLIFMQPYMKEVRIYNGEEVDYDLDLFRKKPINLSANSITQWYGLSDPELIVGSADKWLHIYPQPHNEVVVARSLRYTMPFTSYSSIGKAKFVGMESEYKFSKQHLNCEFEYQPCSTALEMAQFIAGCKYFLGNQSFPFALAEGLKVTRILESHQACPNVVPCGGTAMYFLDQEGLETCIKLLNL